LIIKIPWRHFRLLTLTTAHSAYQSIMTDTLHSLIYIDFTPYSGERTVFVLLMYC